MMNDKAEREWACWRSVRGEGWFTRARVRGKQLALFVGFAKVQVPHGLRASLELAVAGLEEEGVQAREERLLLFGRQSYPHTILLRAPSELGLRLAQPRLVVVVRQPPPVVGGEIGILVLAVRAELVRHS